MIERTARDRRKLLDLVLVSTVFFASVPLAFTLNLRVASIPVLNGFWLATLLVVALNYVTDYRGSHRLVAFYAVAGIFMCGVTLLYWDNPAFDIRWALQDLFSYLGLPLGLALGQLLGKSDFHDLLRRCYFTACIAFAISLALLLSGFLQSTGGVDRQLDGAMYTPSFIIAMSFPCLWSRVRLHRPLQKAAVLSGMGLNLVFALISATRSVFITIIISLVCTAIVKFKKDSRSALWLGAAAIVVAITQANGTLPGLEAFENTKLAERFNATDYANESRYQELTEMLDQMGTSEWIHGVGFGTGFDSTVARQTNLPFATVPHIGITTLLYKAGAPAFLVLMVAPCLAGVFGLVFFRSSNRDPFLAGVAIYFAQACVSGGWGFFPLLLLGAFLYLGLRKEGRSRSSRVLVLKRVPSALDLHEPTALTSPAPNV